MSALTRSKRVALPRRQDNIFRHHYDETITGPDFKRRLNVHVPPRHFHAELSKLAAKFLRRQRVPAAVASLGLRAATCSTTAAQSVALAVPRVQVSLQASVQVSGAVTAR